MTKRLIKLNKKELEILKLKQKEEEDYVEKVFYKPKASKKEDPYSEIFFHLGYIFNKKIAKENLFPLSKDFTKNGFIKCLEFYDYMMNYIHIYTGYSPKINFYPLPHFFTYSTSKLTSPDIDFDYLIKSEYKLKTEQIINPFKLTLNDIKIQQNKNTVFVENMRVGKIPFKNMISLKTEKYSKTYGTLYLFDYYEYIIKYKHKSENRLCRMFMELDDYLQEKYSLGRIIIKVTVLPQNKKYLTWTYYFDEF